MLLQLFLVGGVKLLKTMLVIGGHRRCLWQGLRLNIKQCLKPPNRSSLVPHVRWLSKSLGCAPILCSPMFTVPLLRQLRVWEWFASSATGPAENSAVFHMNSLEGKYLLASDFLRRFVTTLTTLVFTPRPWAKPPSPCCPPWHSRPSSGREGLRRWRVAKSCTSW